MKNPLNDDDYTGNDDQIDDLKDLVGALAHTLREVELLVRVNAPITDQSTMHKVILKQLKAIKEEG